VLSIARHPNDDRRRVVAIAKSNLGEDAALVRSLTFSIETVEIQDEIDSRATVSIGRVHWGDQVEVSAEDLASSTEESGEERTRVAACVESLGEILSDGAMAAKEAQEALKREGFSRTTIFRAVAKAHVQKTFSGYPRTAMWSLGATASRARSRNIETTTTTDTTETTERSQQESQRSQLSQFSHSAETTARNGTASRGVSRSAGSMICRMCRTLSIVRLPQQLCDGCFALAHP
jgi:hypothetical protein